MLKVKLVAAVLVSSGLLFAQGTLALSSSSASGGSASLALTLSTAVGGTQPAALQWTLSYTPSDVLSINAVAGSAAVAAGKSITCTSATGAYRCVLAGVNSNAIQDGVVAAINITLAPTASRTSVGVIDTVGASFDGQSLFT